MLDNLVESFGLIVSGVRRGSRQTILFIIGGSLTIVGGIYVFGSENIRRCWNLLVDSLDMTEENEEFMVEQRERVLVEEGEPRVSQPPLLTSQHVPTIIVTDSDAQELQQALEAQRAVVTELLLS